MRRVLMVLVMLLGSSPLFALEQTQPQPHFQIVAQSPQPRVEVDFGMVQIHTHNANYRIAYLPFLAPLPYSYPRTTQEIPNALVLTGTQIPLRPHTASQAVVTVGR